MNRWRSALLGGMMTMLLFCVYASAEADDLSNPSVVTAASRMDLAGRLLDGDSLSAVSLPDGSWLRLEHPGGIGTLYLIFDLEYPDIALTNDITGQQVTVDTENRIHVSVDLKACFGKEPTSVTISLNSGSARLNEIHCFGPGQVPQWVQRWEPPAEKADLLVLPAHGDDEQLFFAGVLPYYAGERGLEVQVAYLTDHLNFGTLRRHEMLNGLWAVGVRHYPIFGPFTDIHTLALAAAYQSYYDEGLTDDDLMRYVLTLLRRFRPDVVVSHDIDGEYGHGMHRLYTDLLRKAVEISADAEQFPELAEKYGTWDVPKTYLHLYEENPICMDWDQPLTQFGGMTAYQVTRELGFPAHNSQVPYYAWYFEGADTAAEVEKYNPCRYGLYRTTVGVDKSGNDFFENIAPVLTQAPPPETEESIPVYIPQPSLSPIPEKPSVQLSAEKTWLLLPATGTAVLFAITGWQNADERKKKK